MATMHYRKDRDTWLIEWTTADGKQHRKSGGRDKRAASRVKAEVERNEDLRRSGLVTPRELGYIAHEAKPLAGHLEDFRRSLLAKGDSAKHCLMTAHRVRRLAELAGFRRISDVSMSATMDALQSLRTEGGLGQNTINNYIRAIKGFARWLWRDRRAREHHLEHLATSNADVDRRYIRRALSPEEAVRLIRAAETGPTVMGMAGIDRAMLYVLALSTGLRPGRELRSLTPESFDLDGDPPTVEVASAYAKNKRPALQPLPRAVAERLRPWLAGKASGGPVFAGMSNRAAEMIRHDLEVAEIPHRTKEGVIDFYSSRVSFITNLVAGRASIKTCQTLARHSTPSLTIGVYAKVSLHDIKGAVESLPDLTAAATPRPTAATGTDGENTPRFAPRGRRQSPGKPS
jgi:integrase